MSASVEGIPAPTVTVAQKDLVAETLLSTLPAEPVAVAATVPVVVLSTGVPTVPYFSQFRDISSPKWQKLGCGVTGLAMLIELYKPGSVTVDQLLTKGISSGAFIDGAGWSPQGLVNLAGTYGLSGETRDFSSLTTDDALTQLTIELKNGPVIASVHYKFDPASTIPHLAVINGIEGDSVYVNDPASIGPGEVVSLAQFKSAWKKRYIIIYPKTP